MGKTASRVSVGGFFRTYADKLSPKVVQSLLDLLCSQLKNLLSQAGVNLLSSGSDRDNKKHEEGADTEKKDIRGEMSSWIFRGISIFPPLSDLPLCMLMLIHLPAWFPSFDPETAHR